MTRPASLILFAVLLAVAASSAHAGAAHKAVFGQVFSTRTNCTGTAGARTEYHIDECEGQIKMTLAGSVRVRIDYYVYAATGAVAAMASFFCSGADDPDVFIPTIFSIVISHRILFISVWNNIGFKQCVCRHGL